MGTGGDAGAGDRYADLTRSGLAFAFLDLVEQHRPPAILLENVPGLLSSNGGKDLGALLSRLGQLGYWWAYRILDAQFFGVPQRRRRVFVVALHAERGFGADSAAEVLSVGARCDGHSATGDTPRPRAAPTLESGTNRTGGTRPPGATVDTAESLIYNATARFGEFVGDDIAGNLSARDYKSANHLVRPSPDPGGVREADGLAGRLDDRPVAATLNSGGNNGGFRTEPGEHLVTGRATTGADEELLPLGLDSHRYRCCGNGVVSNVSEWIGVRLARTVA